MQSSGHILVAGLQNCHGQAKQLVAGRPHWIWIWISSSSTRLRPFRLVCSLQHIACESPILILRIESAVQTHITPIASSHLEMTDRRRINGPVGGTLPPVFAGDETTVLSKEATGRTRPVNTARPICECFHFHSLSTSLTIFQSPQNWRHSFSIWLCIS